MEHMVDLHFRGNRGSNRHMNKKYPIHAFSIFKLLSDNHHEGREIIFTYIFYLCLPLFI